MSANERGDRKRKSTRRKPILRDKKRSVKKIVAHYLSHPLSVLLIYILILYGVMIPVFFVWRPDLILFR